MKSKNLNAPDLTQHPPRSPRGRLGGYVILPRCLDKGRATLAGLVASSQNDTVGGGGFSDSLHHIK